MNEKYKFKKPKRYTFEKAIKHLKSGGKIYREGTGTLEIFLVFNENDVKYLSRIEAHYGNGMYGTYNFSADDILSTEWMLLEEV
jgi:hypothetical protein